MKTASGLGPCIREKLHFFMTAKDVSFAGLVGGALTAIEGKARRRYWRTRRWPLFDELAARAAERLTRSGPGALAKRCRTLFVRLRPDVPPSPSSFSVRETPASAKRGGHHSGCAKS